MNFGAMWDWYGMNEMPFPISLTLFMIGVLNSEALDSVTRLLDVDANCIFRRDFREAQILSQNIGAG